MDNGSRNIGKGSEKIGHQLLPKGIVFNNSPEEEVFVHLVGISASGNRVVIFFR